MLVQAFLPEALEPLNPLSPRCRDRKKISSPVRGVIPTSTSWILDPHLQSMREMKWCIGYRSEACTSFCRPVPWTCRLWHHSSLQQEMSPFFQASCFWVVGHVIKPMNSRGMSLLPHFLSTQLSSSDASNFRWDTIGMNQASCESTWWCWQKHCKCEKQIHIWNMLLFLRRQWVLPRWWKGSV